LTTGRGATTAPGAPWVRGAQAGPAAGPDFGAAARVQVATTVTLTPNEAVRVAAAADEPNPPATIPIAARRSDALYVLKS
jgi:hypothetical protein